jgi:hypothetical protein
MFINKSSGHIWPLYMRDMEFIKDKRGHIWPLYMRDIEFIKDKRVVIPQLKGIAF